MSSRAKWKCSLCTYENWPASIRCTLCRNLRSSLPTEDEVSTLRSSQNDSLPIDQHLQTLSHDSGHGLRCPACTFINKSNSFKCEQCFQVLCDSPDSESKLKGASASASPRDISISPGSGKWTCAQCTYENWPKSKYCVMCRSSPSLPTQITSTNSADDSDTKVLAINTSTSHFNISSSKPSKFKISDGLWLEACRAVVENEISPVERYLVAGGNLDRRLTKKDCRRLNEPVVVSRCASSGPVRSATEDTSDPGISDAPASDDAGKHGHPVNFRTGWTLLDLAVRHNRNDLVNLFVALNGLQTTFPGSFVSKPATLRSTATSLCPDLESTHLDNVDDLNRSCKPPPLVQPVVPSLSPGTVSRGKWVPCQASPHLAKELRNVLSSGVKHSPGDFPCAFLTEFGTFALPHSITKLPSSIRCLLLSEACDSQAQTELEDDAKAINWWFVPGQKQTNRLFALWNRTAGDCLLDSVLQACWGVFDRENFLRHTLADSLRSCEASFHKRWRDYEALQAACHYILDETQCRRDWENVLSAASRPGGALEQIHIFALSHILRRPIIVYGVKYIKNYLDEPIGLANFQGIYIPLLWEKSFCSKNPIVLGYTRGHFTALVPMEPCPAGNQPTEPRPSSASRASCSSSSLKQCVAPCEDIPIASASTDYGPFPLSDAVASPVPSQCSPHSAHIYLPLVDRQGETLPIHFTTEREASMSHLLLRDWLDVVSSRRGLPLARLRLHSRRILVDRMLDEWLSSYRSLAKFSSPSSNTLTPSVHVPKSTSSLSSSSSSSASSSPPLIEPTDDPFSQSS